MDVVNYLEKKSENNPKDIAKEKRNERRQQLALKEKEKAKKKKGNCSLRQDQQSQMQELFVVTRSFRVRQKHEIKTFLAVIYATNGPRFHLYD